jgi:hypothetical protein
MNDGEKINLSVPPEMSPVSLPIYLDCGKNTVYLGDFLKWVVIPETGEFLESPKEDSKHTAIEGWLWNQQLLSGQPKLQLGHELRRDMASSSSHYAANQPCLIDY